MADPMVYLALCERDPTAVTQAFGAMPAAGRAVI